MAKSIMQLGSHSGADKVAAGALEEAKEQLIDAEKTRLAKDCPRDKDGKIKPARLQLNIHPVLHEHFRKLSFNNNEKMSDLITLYVIDYVREKGIEIDDIAAGIFMEKPSEWE
ncbi:hypothetical protein KXY27_004550 [Salmonella enterica]|nr:hypothetical protein [Salmonella enterica]EHU5767748.1 hypothetical protein [Salmonella enterica]